MEIWNCKLDVLAFFIFGGKKCNQTFGMTDVKSAQQTNSTLKNKTTTIHTKDGSVWVSEIWQIYEMLQFGSVLYIQISSTQQTLICP